MIMNQNVRSQSDWQTAEAAEKTHAKDKLSVIGDWLAPSIVWVVVIALGLAVAGFLLSEE
jgi:hypothetical protein